MGLVFLAEVPQSRHEGMVSVCSSSFVQPSVFEAITSPAFRLNRIFDLRLGLPCSPLFLHCHLKGEQTRDLIFIRPVVHC